MTNTIVSISASAGAGSLAGFITGVNMYATAGLAAAPVALSFVADFIIDKAQEKFDLSDRTAVILKVSTMVVLGAATVAVACFLFGPVTAALVAIPLLLKAICSGVMMYAEVLRKEKIEKIKAIVDTLCTLFEQMKRGVEQTHQELYDQFTSLDNAIFKAMEGKDPTLLIAVKKNLKDKKDKIKGLVSEAQTLQIKLADTHKIKEIKNDQIILQAVKEKLPEYVRYTAIAEEIESILKDPDFMDQLHAIGVVHPLINIRKSITETPEVSVTNAKEAEAFINQQIAKSDEFAKKFQKTFELLDNHAANNPAIAFCVQTIRAPIIKKMDALKIEMDEIKKMNFGSFDQKRVALIDNHLQSIYESIYHRVYVDIFKQLGVVMTQAPFPFHEQFAKEEKQQANDGLELV